MSERVARLLADGASRAAHAMRAETVPRDRVWIAFGCARCDALFDRLARCDDSPCTAGDVPLYRDADDVRELIDGLFARTTSLLDAAAWADAARCECGHGEAAIEGAALVHPMLGSGACLVVARLGSEPTLRWLRLPDGGILEGPVELAAFGRPLTMFEPWSDLVAKLPLAPAMVAGIEVERGVSIVAAATMAALERAIADRLGDVRRLVVALHADVLRSAQWPASLGRLADHVAHDGAAALVLERSIVVDHLRAVARARFSLDVREEQRVWLVGAGPEWPIDLGTVALAIVRRGRTLPEACAIAIDAVASEGRARIATLQAMADRAPGASLDLIDGRAIARRSDGDVVGSIALEDVPLALDDQELAREASYLFDLAPAWADRTRICACGAAATIERRLIAWPSDLMSDPLATFGEPPRVAEVAALCCDRHARVLTDDERANSALDREALLERIATDRSRAIAEVRGFVDDAITVLRGPLAAGLALDPARLAALREFVTLPDRVTAWAFGADVLAIADPACSDERAARAIARTTGLGAVPFTLRLSDLDLDVAPIGRLRLR